MQALLKTYWTSRNTGRGNMKFKFSGTLETEAQYSQLTEYFYHTDWSRKPGDPPVQVDFEELIIEPILPYDLTPDTVKFEPGAFNRNLATELREFLTWTPEEQARVIESINVLKYYYPLSSRPIVAYLHTAMVWERG